MRRVPSFVLFLVPATVVQAAAGPQAPLHEFRGTQDSDHLGISLAIPGDVNLDGFDDILIGADQDDGAQNIPPTRPGFARLYSGLDGTVLRSYTTSFTGSYLGQAVDGAGDVDADGVPDVIIGAPRYPGPHGNGRVWVYSGATGNELHQFAGDPYFQHFGYRVGGLGDVDNDGHDDFFAHMSHGSRVWSGATGAQLHVFTDQVRIEEGVGDVNGDGNDDIIVTFVGQNSGVYVLSGADASTLSFHPSPALRGSAAGDSNADGRPDYLITDVESNNPGGIVTLHSGLDGSVLLTLIGTATHRIYAGYAVGDVDHDGRDDFAMRENDVQGTTYTLSMAVYSGLDGHVLYRRPFPGASRLEVAAGDVNGDGIVDLLIGDPFDDLNPWVPEAGIATVWSTREPIGTTYCAGLPNSTLVPGLLAVTGSANVADNSVELVIGDLPPGLFGYALVGNSSGSQTPPGSQGLLCLSGNLGRFRSQLVQGPVGVVTVDLTAIPTSPVTAVQPGESWRFQHWYRDVNPQSTSNFTNAQWVVFQ